MEASRNVPNIGSTGSLFISLIPAGLICKNESFGNLLRWVQHIGYLFNGDIATIGQSGSLLS